VKPGILNHPAYKALQAPEALMLHVLWTHANSGSCFCNNATLFANSKIGETRGHVARRALRDAGFVTWQAGSGRGHASEYQLHFPPLQTVSRPGTHSWRQRVSRRGTQTVSRRGTPTSSSNMRGVSREQFAAAYDAQATATAEAELCTQVG
jgi:hypothetical protein